MQAAADCGIIGKKTESGEDMKSSDYIGVMDSGVGGISVLRELRRLMPDERYLFFGDSANAPYGSRPAEEIRRLTMAIAEKLFDRGCKALVIACNTATSAAVDTLRSTWPDRIIVGIEPALKPAADRFPGGNIGVMATEVTLREAKFAALMSRFSSTCRVSKLPMPGLVELVEQGLADSPQMDAFLRKNLENYVGKLDALVLGCTHYPFAKASLRRVLGDEVVLLDGGEGTARETRRRLAEAGLLYEGPGELLIENSSENPAMIDLCQKLLEE